METREQTLEASELRNIIEDAEAVRAPDTSAPHTQSQLSSAPDKGVETPEEERAAGASCSQDLPLVSGGAARSGVQAVSTNIFSKNL